MWIDSGESYKDVIRVLGTIHHTPHLSNVLLVSRSFERRERHEIPLASNSQISSAPFEQFVGSPSQLLMDQGSTASEQEDVSLLRDSIPFDPPRSESADDERSDSAIEFLLSNPQTNTSLLSVPILENAHIDDTFSTVTHVTALRSPDPTSTLVTDIGWFRTYVTEDEQRCAEYNLSNPWLAPRAQTIMQKLAEYPDQHRAVFLKLWAGVCSTFSVISLQETMQTLRRGICAELLPPNLDLSVNDRLQLIESAEKCVTGLLLVRRLHVLQLLKDEPRTANGVTWINFDISSGSTKTRRPGNPLIMQESAVTKSLMERFYPDLGPSSTEYRKVYEKLKKLRKLGRRLEMLASNFGTGILGLLPCSDFDSQGFNIAVSDNALLKPTDDEFSCFMTLLDSTEGDMLRKFSCAAAPIVDGIFAGDLSRIDQYPLQQLQAEKISKLPRCSEPLLACFAGNMSTQLQDGSSSGS
ncbi:hypothetical protein CRV24_008753 [Beauveria bassiana]|nr:hypothetical protein CRV24_008753 [Beauveria bassiana]KAH8715287.1 hypothetical protein HC256_004124 [Beauveria bassiana]